MTIRNHSRSRRSSGLFAAAKGLNTIAGLLAGYAGAQHSAELERQQAAYAAERAENLRLRNVIADLQQGVNANKVVEGDLKIELLKLRIEAQKRKMGMTDTPFVAQGYAEPGNIREEERNRPR